MVAHSRYSVTNDESGIDGDVLKNKLGIRSQAELDDAETVLLSDAYNHFFDLLTKDELIFDVGLLFRIHKYFLEPLYSWAGKTRTVSISKGDVLFAPVEYIPNALETFGALLARYVTTKFESKRKIASGLAVLHCELNAIHPFREGNGRAIRLFLDLLAVRAECNPIDWSVKTHDEYNHACIDGMSQKYSRMERVIFSGLIRRG